MSSKASISPDTNHIDGSKSSKSCEITLEENDVLTGRGIRHAGNIHFRQLCRERKEKYLSSSRRRLKVNVAEEIYSIITGNNGRFLREVTSSTEPSKLQSERGTRTFLEVEKEVAISKIKHALRDIRAKGVYVMRDSETINAISLEREHALPSASNRRGNTYNSMLSASPISLATHQNNIYSNCNHVTYVETNLGKIALNFRTFLYLIHIINKCMI
jgi:hypothetical protein